MKMGEKKISKSYNRVKVSPYTIRFTLEEPIKLRQQGYKTTIGYMSGGLELRLSNIYNKTINKLRKYKKKILKKIYIM